MGVVTVAFFLIHFIPGDPVEIMLGEQASTANKEALREQLGLNMPLPAQYVRFLKNLSHGDLGKTLRSKEPVMKKLTVAIEATVELALAAFFVGLIIGIPLGVLAAVFQGTIIDRIVLLLSSLGVSMPAFWVGPMFIYVFAISLGWFPVSDRTGWSSLVLPTATLSLGLIASLSRMTRASMLEVVNQDFIRTARAKGVSEFKIYFRHGLKNSLLPVVTLLGLQLGSLLTGAVITEAIFDWPGVGSLFYQAIQNRDYPLVQGCVLFVAIVYLIMNMLTDFTYAFIDPRLRQR